MYQSTGISDWRVVVTTPVTGIGHVGSPSCVTFGILSTTCRIVITSDSTQSLLSVVALEQDDGLALTLVFP